MTLVTNRYGVVTPTQIHSTGIGVSTPIYLTPSSDHLKALLNKFREIKAQQLIDMGWKEERPVGASGLVVADKTAPPKTQIETDLGMDEENLRFALFGRNGIQERLVIKLQVLTGMDLVSRSQIEETFALWLDHLFQTSDAKPAGTAKKKTSPKTKAKATASV